MRGLHDLHRRIFCKSSERHNLGGRDSSNPPGRFKDSRSALSFLIDTLADIIIPAGGYEPGILTHGLIIQSRLLHTGTNFVVYTQTLEGIPSAPHANQIRAAVNRSSVIVRRESLAAVISELDIIYHDMAHAQCRNMLEVLLQYQ